MATDDGRLTDKVLRPRVSNVRPAPSTVIGPAWRSIGESVYQRLDSMSLNWTSINPLAYANAGEAEPFCSLILSIGLKPHSLLYDAAVAATAVVKKILAGAGFPGIEVAFVESVVTRFRRCRPQPPLVRPPLHHRSSLSIAPLRYPRFEGTGALFFRLSKEDNRTAILTCAHVARPPPVYSNTGTTENASQLREEVVALGNTGYNNAVKAMMSTVRDLSLSIAAWNDVLDSLGDLVQGEPARVSETRQEHMDLVAGAKKKIEQVNAFHDEVTKRRTTPDQRKIEASVDPHGFAKDWALIELYNEKIDWASSKETMSTSPADQANDRYPQNGLLQAHGVVLDDEIRNPQHLDVHGEKCLLVVKNGSTTGTTVGRVNGLESFTRIYDEYGVKQTSVDSGFAVLAYKTRGKISDPGDSGSIFPSRDGRIVGILTGGAGSTDETDITYLTPYCDCESVELGEIFGRDADVVLKTQQAPVSNDKFIST
ncbi:hypothetical protein B0H12DRAFT_1212216 [Mycena haematopus]|nr:hypothetical protein B0H12DRAFT_1212216 [Mycena haematopus]